MGYEQVKDLRPAEFKRHSGVESETFRRMTEVVSNQLRKERVSGRPTKKVELHETLEVLAESGCQDLDGLHEKSRKPRNGQLNDGQKKGNRELARRRVVVEHVIRSLNVFRVLAERYRKRRQRFSLRFKSIARLDNYGLSRG